IPYRCTLFGAGLVYPTSPIPKSVAIGEFNNDGYLDVVVGATGAATANVLLAVPGGAGDLQAKQDFVLMAPAVGIAAISNGSYDDFVTSEESGTKHEVEVFDYVATPHLVYGK